MAEAADVDAPSRMAGGGPAGKAPLVRAVRAKSAEFRKVASQWLDRFHEEKYGAIAELIALVLAVADVPSKTTLMKEDLEDHAPQDVITELTAALALEASEKGADFSQHWLVSREKGAARVKENYPKIWRELLLAPTADLVPEILQHLRAWTVALAECQFRSIRHAATVAALSLVEGLQIQCKDLQVWCEKADRQLKEMEVASTRATLSKELKSNRQCLKSLCSARDSFATALLSKRSKDVDFEIRRSCMVALQGWARLQEGKWRSYLHFAFNDPEARVRAAALDVLPALLTSGHVAMATGKALGQDLRERVLARCQDVDALAGAAALRAACALAQVEALEEEDYDQLIDLVWDPEPVRREAAWHFVNRFVLEEGLMELPEGASGQRHLEVLLEFLCEFAEGHYQLAERLVATLWREAPSLSDWDAMAQLLLGEERHERHVAAAFLAEATLRLAFDDWAQHGTQQAEALLQRACGALGGRLPQLLSAFQAEKKAMCQAAKLVSYLLRFCCLSSANSDLLSEGEAVAQALSNAFLRQPDFEALEHLALAMAHLQELSTAAHPVVRELAKGFHRSFLQLAPLVGQPLGGDVPVADSLLATCQRLRILAKACDVSLGDVGGFVSTALSLVDDSAVGAELTAVLLELLTLVSLRHCAQLMPEPLAAVAADVRDEAQLRQAPAAAEDLLEVATVVLEKEDERLRSAAFAAALSVLGAWWTRAQLAGEAACKCVERLQNALSAHLGQLLAEANKVPAECILLAGMPEPGDLLKSTAFSHLFVLLQQGMATPGAVPDAERIKLAQLCCLMVATCRHAQVAASSLPSLVLSLALSPREDLQQVTWAFLKRLRKDAHSGPTQAEEFFTTLLAAVKVVHQDNGTVVAKELSSRLFQHVGVGKLSPLLQAALVNALQQGVSAAAAGAAEGFLEALTPWITKHVVEDQLVESLMQRAKEQANQAMQAAGLEKFLEACESTTRKGQDTPEKPSKRRRTTKQSRQTPTSTQAIKDAMDLP